MPTADRRRFIPSAIRYFLMQTYPHKELLILDDGIDSVADLIPDDPRIRYFREPKGPTLGAKRNRLCGLARGAIITHWDDDDWYAPQRLERQVAALTDPGKLLCGIEHLFYYDTQKQAAFEYFYKDRQRRWLSLLCYRRGLWQANPFPNIQVGSDTRFLWHLDQRRMVVIENDGLNVCFIHGANVSPKRTSDPHWRPVAVDNVRQILGADWHGHPGTAVPATGSSLPKNRMQTDSPETSKTIHDPPSADWTVIVPTYNRPAMLAALLEDFVREENCGLRLDVRVYDDASSQDYTAVRDLLSSRGWQYYRAEYNHGKQRYWRWIDRAFGDMAACDLNTMLLFIHDDYRLKDHFFSRAAATWQAIDDPRKVALTVSVNPARRYTRCWTGVDPQKIGEVWKTQWVDGAFVAAIRFFKVLGYKVPPVSESRWRKAPSLSSGVGRNLSVHLVNAGYHLYRTHENLAHHQEGPSQLHPHLQRYNAHSPHANDTERSDRSDNEETCSPIGRPSANQKWIVVVMTYERPLRLLDLLNDIQRERGTSHDVAVRVYNDASQMDYAAPLAAIQRHGWRYTCCLL